MKLYSVINWNLIKILADLKIITKTSYAMILIVPILSFFWVQYNVMSEKFNNKIIHFFSNNKNLILSLNSEKQKLEHSFDYFKDSIAENCDINLEFQENLENISKELKTINIITNNLNKTISSNETLKSAKKSFPHSWLCIYIASIFSVIAHILFQAFSPGIVKRFSKKDYITKRKNDYKQSPSFIAIEKARHFVELYRKDDDFVEKAEKKLNELYKLRSKMLTNAINETPIRILLYAQKKLSDLSAQRTLHDYQKWVKDDIDKRINKVGQEEITFRQELDFIENGAESEYLLETSKRLPAIIISAILYIAAVYLILKVIIFQTFNVIQSANIGSFFNIFFSFFS